MQFRFVLAYIPEWVILAACTLLLSHVWYMQQKYICPCCGEPEIDPFGILSGVSANFWIE